MVVLLGVALGVVGAVPTAASAYPRVEQLKDQVLVFPAIPANPGTCQQRTIWLARGVYEWRQVNYPARLSPLPASYRTIALAPGDYTWRDCIWPTARGYRVESALTPSWGGTALAQVDWPNPVLAPGGPFYDSVRWGSTLLWLQRD
ncbi:hypothetical protein [Micromonospora sp. NPDC005324]|uniref:hypothetical protein n=1 Tax=Micromonospora sp. NPDC005324 TaxID=3157033 RepID=UPI0033A2DDE4